MKLHTKLFICSGLVAFKLINDFKSDWVILYLLGSLVLAICGMFAHFHDEDKMNAHDPDYVSNKDVITLYVIFLILTWPFRRK